MKGETDILLVKARLLDTWGLRESPPFRGDPSGDIEQLSKVFVGRREEMRRAILTLDDGENILVRGMIGIGKTAFIMAVLFNMEEQTKVLGRPVLPLHIRQFAGGTRDDLYRVVLYALAKRLASDLKLAREILFALTGEEITRSRGRGIKASLEVQVPQLLSSQLEGEIKGDESRVLKISHPEHFVEQLLAAACRKYRRVIIAIDDLERSHDQGSIKIMFENTLDLLRDKRCAFILTGRTLTIFEDIYAHGLDIFNETIPLRPLSLAELRLITVRTLNLVRREPDDQSVFPFTDEVVETMVSKSFGIPRQYVLLCHRILKIAIEKNAAELNSAVFDQSFDQLQNEIAETDVPPEIRRILYLGLQQGGFSIDKDADLDQVFDTLGITRLSQFVEFAEGLVQRDILTRIKNDSGAVMYRLAPGVEKLALTGGKL